MSCKHTRINNDVSEIFHHSFLIRRSLQIGLESMTPYKQVIREHSMWCSCIADMNTVIVEDVRVVE